MITGASTTTVMSSETQSITDTHRTKLSTFAKLRKSQSSPKLRGGASERPPVKANSKSSYRQPTVTSYTTLNSPTSNTPTPTSSTVTTAPASVLPSTRATTPLPRTRVTYTKSTKSFTTTKKPKSATTTTTTSSSSPGFFKKISHEWHSFIHRLKSISEDAFVIDNLIDDLFVDDDIDDHMAFDKLVGNAKGYNTTDENFLQDFKKFKSLDKMYEHYNGATHSNNHSVVTHSHALNNQDVGSSTTVVSDQTSFNVRTTLQDVIRHHQAHFENIDEESLEGEEEDKEEEALDNITATGSSTNIHDIPQFSDIDFTILRKEFENLLASTASSLSTSKFPYDPFKTHLAAPPGQQPSASTSTSTSSSSTPSTSKKGVCKDINVGTILWNYRRRKWLYCPDRTKAALRIENDSLANVPKESYYKVYCSLIHDNRVLKNDKRINLRDLIKIVNIGWIEEKKWEQ